MESNNDNIYTRIDADMDIDKFGLILYRRLLNE